MDVQLILELLLLAVCLVVARMMYLVHKVTTGHTREASAKRMAPCRTMICIGSGGHTTEMLNLVTSLDFKRYTPRYYIVASSDTTSCGRIERLEARSGDRSGSYRIIRIPRSREVQQGFVSSAFTTAFSVLYSIPVIALGNPELVLCNGPGTCVPICLLAFLMKVGFMADPRIVFVESFCRVRTLSLTGHIMAYVADNFLVQWPGLKQKLRRADHIGQLV